MGICCSTCLICCTMRTNFWKRWPVVPAAPDGFARIPEKSGQGGPPVIKMVIGTLGSRWSSKVSINFSMSKSLTSPICIGWKCSSRTVMHSMSVSQLTVNAR